MSDRSKKIKKIITWIAIIILLVVAVIVVKKVMDLFDNTIETYEWEVERLKRNVKYQNESYMKLVFELDSIQGINDSLLAKNSVIDERKEEYKGLYQYYKNLYYLQSGEDPDTNNVVDSAFHFADEVIRMQEVQIKNLEKVNINNNYLIIGLRSELDSTRHVMLDCEELAIKQAEVTTELQEKARKLKNSRNIGWGIAIVEAVVITLAIILAK